MIRPTCVVVADGGRARLFVMAGEEGADLRERPRLVERGALVNSELEVDARERSDDHGTGRRQMFRAGPTHGYEDRWDRESIRLKGTFAREVVNAAVRMAADSRAYEILLVAEPRMLGLIRQHEDAFQKAHIRCTEHAADLTRLSALELHQRLAGVGLVPAPMPAPMAAVA